ncbi:MAG TPA: protein kinase [Kofleriaceae bacterium]|nr:protein kinase [Kofleriaceae bacterium]
MSQPLDTSQTSGIRHGSKVGRFVVEGQLGAGGMGVVYAAHDRELDRRVALKVLKGTDDAEQRTRLMREGQAMARVTHENVITVHEVGMEGSMVFLAQELLDGGSLRDWLLADKKRSQSEILAKFIAAGRGLAAAHRAGLVHRDFKPDNVLLGKDGRVRVSDFGLARSLESSAAALAETQKGGGSTDENLANPMLTMTRTGAVMGTPLYMSPEQHAGEPADERSDQFSFCVALYEALHGDTPFPGKTAVALADAVMSGRMKPPPKTADVPSRIRKILLRGLSTIPGERYPSMDALLADLTHDPARKRTRFVLLAAVIILIAGAVVGGYALSSHESRKASEVPARRTVAVLGFKNTAADPASAWISQGMSQLLAAQLLADDVKVVSAEEALRARSELHLPDTDTYSADTLNKIRERLGADAVIGGSYFVSNGELTLAISVQDIPRKKSIPIQLKGTTAELPALAEKAGGEIRTALGISSVAIVKKSYDVLPHDAVAQREFIEGNEALRKFDFRNAKMHLLAAVKAEPDFAPSHLALAKAYSGLFDADAARASAKQALATASSVGGDQQLVVRRDAYKLLDQIVEAREQANQLFVLHRDNLEYGLALAELQEPDDAVRTLATLRKLAAPAGTDPRIDIAEGRAELERQAAPRALELARHATQEATARNAAGVAAEARQLEGEVLVATGELATAQDTFEDARKRFEAANDQIHKLQTLESLADLSLERGQLDDALKSYDALASLREQAGQTGVAARATARAAYALALAGKNADAEKRLARAQKMAADDPVAIPTIDLVAGVLGWAKGDGPTALGRLDKCNARFASVAPGSSVLCLLLRGEIQAELGDAAAAKKTFDDAKAVADKAGNVYRSQQAELRLAQLELDEESPADEEAKIADRIVERAGAIRIAAATHGATSLEARAGIMLARAHLAQGNSQDALDVIAKVQKQEDIRIEVDRLITDALSKDAAGDATSRDTLDEVKKIADKQGCVTLQLEARLALAEVLATSKEPGETEKGRAELATIQQEAVAKNLGRIAKRAEILSRP